MGDMGSSGESIAKEIDVSVGGLVWVRRRNGSWWPGKILGPDELPETCSVSPRSGTPVKLLGREDASVDWYNLEKSKRVKAFRCGEYDECIRKAKAAAANSSRKAVKYARREDAIIHALEIESARLGKDHPDFFSRIDKDEEQQTKEESYTSSNPAEDGKDLDEELSSSEEDSDSAQELSQSGVSFEAPNHTTASKEQQPVHGTRRRTPNDSEDDGTEGSKRMRGLDDLGMGVASSLKRKRSQVAHVHDFLKRKNRRRPLAQVLESTTMVSIPIMCEPLPSPTGSTLAGVSDSKVFGLQSNESKRTPMVLNNDTDSISVACGNGIPLDASGCARDSSLVECEQKENGISSILELPENENGSSDRLFDVPFVAEEKNSAGLSPIVCCTSQKAQGCVGAQSSQGSQVEAMSFGSEEINESGSTSSSSDDFHYFTQRMEKGTSKWKLKGKRNLRHTSRKVDYCRNAGFHASENSINRLKSRSVTEIQVNELRGWSRNVSLRESHTKGPTAELLTPQRLLPYRQSRFTVNPKYDSSDFSLRHHIADSSLYEVTLEVKASYRPQHVPYISLMSRLNGKPIVGHPLTVEVLDDGFCDNLLASGSECHSSSYDLDEDCDEKSAGADMVYEPKPSSAGRFSTKHRKVLPRGSPSQSPKTRKNGILSKKIRKLSSLTGSQQQNKEKKPMVEKPKGPAVACVPLKVVFSRINEALNSSIRPANCTIGSSVG